ncbi:fimbria/pilus outer membrane usher protein [Pseudomonas sp. NPDC007930]|uniref:fimbria/pilus outer membrane usher protein n=1 Tax=Pseudomonas sp. NPDC007930 TaxID=3364417 RepID=UPI0036E0BE1A
MNLPLPPGQAGRAAVRARLPLAGLLLGLAGTAQASTGAGFDPAFLRATPGYPEGTAATSLASLAEGDSLPEGRYRFSVYLNDEPLGAQELALERGADGRLLPCLSRAWLVEAGVQPQALDALAQCTGLMQAIEGSRVALDTQRFTLTLQVPQAAMQVRRLGATQPHEWDSGVSAAFVNYQASLSHARSRYGGSSPQHALYLNGGANLGDWRLRTSQALSDSGQRWQRHTTYAQRDISPWRSTLTLGETFSGGEVFRSVPLRGVQLATEMDMLPDVLQAYAPVIRGIAKDRARVEVRQNGYLLYTTTVSPGPFTLDDLSVTGSGELEVRVIEEDGSEANFTQAYSTLGNLLRDGVWRYSAAVGQYVPAGAALSRPMLAQATLARGLPERWTLYGGGQAAGFYHAGSLGLARDLGAFGALAGDLTHSQTPGLQGMSYALRYGKAFASRTQLRFAGYRYSTEGFREFDEAVRDRHASTALGSRRSRLEAALYQGVGERSSLNLTYSQERYWGAERQRRQFQGSFNTRWRELSISLYAAQTFDERRREIHHWGLGLTLPLGTPRASSLSYDAQHSGERLSQRASLNGRAQGLPLSWRAAVAHNDSQGSQGSASANWQSQAFNLGLGASAGARYQSVSLNASGAWVAHAGTLIAGPYLGETFGIVEVPGIAGVGVSNSASKTNAQGLALAPYLRPYRRNSVRLDTSELGPDVEIANGLAQLVPRRGAVTKVRFEGRQVRRLLLTAHAADGQPLPFGAELLGRDGGTLGILGQAGQALLESDGQPLRLLVRWGASAGERCWLALDPAQAKHHQGFETHHATCTD